MTLVGRVHVSFNIKFMLGKVLMHYLPACFAGLEIAMLCSGNDSCIIASFKRRSVQLEMSPLWNRRCLLVIVDRYDICAKID